MSSDYCIETLFYATAKSIVVSIKLFIPFFTTFIAKYFYGGIFKRDESNFSLLSSFSCTITRNIKIKHKSGRNSKPWLMKGENGLPFLTLRWAGFRRNAYESMSEYASTQTQWEWNFVFMLHASLTSLFIRENGGDVHETRKHSRTLMFLLLTIPVYHS